MGGATAMQTGIDLTLSEEQREMRALAHEFAQNELRPAAAVGEETGKVPEGLLAKAYDAGLTTYSIPEEFGGGGLDFVTSSLIFEELAWGDAGLATLLGSGQLFAGGVLASEATDEQKQEWLSLVTKEGGAFGAIAFSEPGAGSDFAAIQTRAEKTSNGWKLNGEKTWISGGTVADGMVVFARTSDGGAGGISCFVVKGDDPGVSSSKLDLFGFRSGQTASIFLSDVEIPENRLLGPEGDGFATAMRFFQHSRPHVAASAIGVARAAFEYAVNYANERTAFGKPIMHNQAVSFQLADVGMRIDAARALTWKACCAADRGVDIGLVGSYAKAYAADVAMFATTTAIQVMGGAGLSNDHPVGRWMRDAKTLQIVEGTSEVQRLIVSRYYSSGMCSTEEILSS